MNIIQDLVREPETIKLLVTIIVGVLFLLALVWYSILDDNEKGRK